MPRSFRFLLVAVLFLAISSPALSQEARIERFSLGYEGVPLKYQRVFDYDHPYPEINGLLVESTQQSDPAVKQGLRVGNIIQTVNDIPVRDRQDIRRIVIRNFGQPLTFKIHKKTPRYEYRLRDNPFYEPEGEYPYQIEKFTVTYDTPGLERNPVVAGPTRELYHKPEYDHSPDTTGHTVYLNPTKAREDNLRPCPVCFPSGDGSSLQNLLQQEFMGSSQFVQSLTKGASRIEDVPEAATTLIDRLSPRILRESLEPRIALFQDSKMYAFGLPGGELIFTYNLYRYAETPPERRIFLAHLLAHADQEHDHQPVQENQIRSLVERAIERTTGVSFKFEQLKEWSPAIPGFSYYNEILEEGYGDLQEREAIFYGMVYLYKAGYDLDGIKAWIQRKEDMQQHLHPYWLDFTLGHPIPLYIDYDIERWKKLIPKHFEREATLPAESR